MKNSTTKINQVARTSFLCFWWSHQESNLDRQFRKLVFYPLNYETSSSWTSLTSLAKARSSYFIYSSSQNVSIHSHFVCKNETISPTSSLDKLETCITPSPLLFPREAPVSLGRKKLRNSKTRTFFVNFCYLSRIILPNFLFPTFKI